MEVWSVADVAEEAGLPVRTIYTYVYRRRHDLPGHAGIPLPDASLADRPGWWDTTIQPWLDERRGQS